MLIAMRNAMMAGGKLSAKSYVQDGLVAMWDGIENAGWGQHDASATTWKDLTGNGHDIIAYGNPTWTPDAAVLDGATCFRSSAMSTVLAAEVVFKRAVATGFMVAYQNGTYHLIGLNDALVCLAHTLGSGTSTYRNYFDPIIDTGAHSCSAQYSNWSFWRDGIQQSSRGVNANGANGNYIVIGARWFNNAMSGYMKGNINVVRLYSRALTADEIAANYAVDEARFNLP